MIQSVESRESFCKGWGGITNEPTYFENCVHYIFFFFLYTHAHMHKVEGVFPSWQRLLSAF